MPQLHRYLALVLSGPVKKDVGLRRRCGVNTQQQRGDAALQPQASLAGPVHFGVEEQPQRQPLMATCVKRSVGSWKRAAHNSAPDPVPRGSRTS